jgi:outer membrane lipoprotein-sorting protein
MKKAGMIFVALLAISACAWSDARAMDILKKADAVILPANAEFTWSMTVRKAGEDDRLDRFVCWKKGDLKYLFFHVWPQTNYGQAMIRVDSTIWHYLPLADEVLKESYKAAFLDSDLSFADVMYNELAIYYDATIIGDSDGDTLTLELKAKPGAAGYARIVVTVDKNNLATLKREYYSKNGRLLKVIVFSDLKFSGSRLSAMKLLITQPMLKGQSTIAEFSDIQEKGAVKEQLFSLNYVKAFKPKASY